jgi:uncharacterized membrane protein YqjE
MDASHDPEPGSVEDEDNDAGAARELTLHLFRMLQTRADAAGIALQSEMKSFSTRLKLQVIAWAAMFIALWAGIVLLAIVLPPHLRVPVLSAVVGLLFIGGVWALLAAKRTVSSRDVGSLSWFIDSIKLDIEMLSRALKKPRPPVAEETTRSRPDDLAA